MQSLPTRFWADMRWQDFASADMGSAIAVLPVAAIEQHGPHLPVGVDAMIMDGYLKRVVQALPADLPVLFLPVQKIGVSPEHLAFPGTLTLSPETALKAWTEIGTSIRRAGCRKLVIVNSHGGNVGVIDLAARHLRVTQQMLVVTASWHRFGYPPGLFSDAERTHGIHAGDIETSLMLAFQAGLTDMKKAGDFVPESVAMEREFCQLRAGSPAGFGWMAQDLSATGAMGNASLASADKGRMAADFGAAAFCDLLGDVHAFDLARLMAGPGAYEYHEI